MPGVRGAAVDWQAGLDTKQSLLAAGDLVAANRVAEALTNVARHSRASKARVELTETADWVVLEAHDDGIGFDPAAELRGGLDHFGLAGMRERVELAGGTWTVWSRPGSGTVLAASLPKDLMAA